MKNKGYVFGVKAENVVRQVENGNIIYLIDKYNNNGVVTYSIKKAINEEPDYDFDFDFENKTLAISCLMTLKENRFVTDDEEIVFNYQMQE